MTVTELVRLGVDAEADPAVLRRAIELPGLAEVWREEFRERLGD